MKSRSPSAPETRSLCVTLSVRLPLTRAAALAVVFALWSSSQIQGQNNPDGVAGLGYYSGDPAATVHVVEFADFGCSACALFASEAMPRLRNEYIDQGRIRWQFIPFLLGGFRHASEAARAAECAGAQGEFAAMHDRLFSQQQEWQRSRRPGDLFAEFAGELQVDPDLWQQCYRENGGRSRTTANTRAARRLRVRGTPTFFINGRRVEGALRLELFEQLISEPGGGIQEDR